MEKNKSTSTQEKEKALEHLKELFPHFDRSFFQRIEELIRIYEDTHERQQGRPSTLV